MSTYLELTVPTLAVGSCYPANPQTLVDEMFSSAKAVWPDSTLTLYNFGTSAPTSADLREYPWINGTDGHLYIYADGVWRRPHPIPASSPVRLIYVGTEASVPYYDGGDGGTTVNATLTAGPMWEIDTNLSARIPIGVGTLPISSTAIAVTGTGGVEKVTLTSVNIPPHKHLSPMVVATEASEVFEDLAGTSPITGDQKATGRTSDPYARFHPYTDYSGGETEGEIGATTAHDNMPPYYGVYFIKRTSRLYYTP